MLTSSSNSRRAKNLMKIYDGSKKYNNYIQNMQSGSKPLFTNLPKPNTTNTTKQLKSCPKNSNTKIQTNSATNKIYKPRNPKISAAEKHSIQYLVTEDSKVDCIPPQERQMKTFVDRNLTNPTTRKENSEYGLITNNLKQSKEGQELSLDNNKKELNDMQDSLNELELILKDSKQRMQKEYNIFRNFYAMKKEHAIDCVSIDRNNRVSNNGYIAEEEKKSARSNTQSLLIVENIKDIEVVSSSINMSSLDDYRLSKKTEASQDRIHEFNKNQYFIEKDFLKVKSDKSSTTNLVVSSLRDRIHQVKNNLKDRMANKQKYINFNDGLKSDTDKKLSMNTDTLFRKDPDGQNNLESSEGRVRNQFDLTYHNNNKIGKDDAALRKISQNSNKSFYLKEEDLAGEGNLQANVEKKDFIFGSMHLVSFFEF